MAHTLSLAHFDPYGPAPWWVVDLIEELRAQRLERQHRAHVAAGWKPLPPDHPAYLGPYNNPKRAAALAESMARLMAGATVKQPPPGFD